MLLKDVSFQRPQENIIYDNVLLSSAEKGIGGEALRFWESQKTFIVLGRVSKEDEDVKIGEAVKDRIPVLRRASGGGTVLQGKGCLNYSLILSKEKEPQILDLRKSYHFILNKVIDALKILGIDASFKPASDIVLDAGQKKISGNAQKRGRKFILHHGTILYDFDIEMIEKYLKTPLNVPVYRRGRSHLDFVSNVPSTLKEIKDALKKAFEIDRQENFVTEKEKELLINNEIKDRIC